jgi:hypothetical protein
MDQREGGQAQAKDHDIVSLSSGIKIQEISITTLMGLPPALSSHAGAKPCAIVRIDKRMADFFAPLSQTTADFDES